MYCIVENAKLKAPKLIGAFPEVVEGLATGRLVEERRK